jgi:hypothetical protein
MALPVPTWEEIIETAEQLDISAREAVYLLTCEKFALAKERSVLLSEDASRAVH